MSILFVLPRKPNLNAKKQKLVVCLKPLANALDLSSVQALNILSSTSWSHLNTLLRGVERCWVLLSQIWTWSNFSLNTAQHFLCFAVIHVWLNKVECICTATLNMLSPRTRSAQRIQRFSAMIEHEPLWNRRTAQHVESLLRSFGHLAQQHLNQHSTCWELVQWTNSVHLHEALVVPCTTCTFFNSYVAVVNSSPERIVKRENGIDLKR